MSMNKMIAIEYNMWMSIIKLIGDAIRSSNVNYDGLNTDIDIPPKI